jgi:hypothetical protein
MNQATQEVSFVDPEGIRLDFVARLVAVAQEFHSHVVVSCNGVRASLQLIFKERGF